mmetsp:Transcript_13398/g.32742  ORF Transcript_13398/g.32742 Transcript_13398/m.32742 type:complete len:84 (+) Transcript_13398:629-880(+)
MHRARSRASQRSKGSQKPSSLALGKAQDAAPELRLAAFLRRETFSEVRRYPSMTSSSTSGGRTEIRDGDGRSAGMEGLPGNFR